MAEALEQEAADGDHVGTEEGDEVERDDDVEGNGAAEFLSRFRSQRCLFEIGGRMVFLLPKSVL